MGKSVAFRNFVSDGGDVVRFSSLRFRNCVNEYVAEKTQKDGEKYTLDKFYEDAAAELNYGVDSIKKWRLGQNGPGDFVTIKKLATYIGKDYHELLVDKDDNPVSSIDDAKFKSESNDEKEIIVQMYQLFVDYIYWFTGAGAETKAFRLLENPSKERYEYLSKLYCFLDSSALALSESVYYGLRKFITELEYIPHASYSGIRLPRDWTSLNPYLESEDFDGLLTANSSELADVIYDCTYIGEYKEVRKKIGDGDDDYIIIREEVNKENKYYVPKCDGDAIGHMLFEDMPELHEVSQEVRNQRKEHFEGRSDLSVAIEMSCVLEDYDINTLVCREYANTLLKLMKKRFPQHF